MKSLRIEFFQDPPHERVLVDGKEQPGVLVEVAFLDAPAGCVTLADFAYRLGGKGSTAGGRSDEKVATETKEGEQTPTGRGQEKTGNEAEPPSKGEA